MHRQQAFVAVFPAPIRLVNQPLIVTSQNGLPSLDSQHTEPLLPARWGLVAGTLSLKGQLRLNGRSIFLKEMECLFSGKFTIKKHTSFFPSKTDTKKRHPFLYPNR